MTAETIRASNGTVLPGKRLRVGCPALSDKQIRILAVIKDRSVDDHGNVVDIDLDQLLERLSYRTTKESMQFSLRALIRHGLIDKAGNDSRRGRLRVLYAMTEDGLAVTSGEENAARRSGLVGKTPKVLDGETPIREGQAPGSPEQPDFDQELSVLTETSASESVADLPFEVSETPSDPQVSSPVSSKVASQGKPKTSRKSKTSVKKDELIDPRGVSLDELISSLSEELEIPPEESFE